MLHLLLRWILDAIALLIVSWLVPGFKVSSLPSALIAVIANRFFIFIAVYLLTTSL